jgi:Tfp pilus assembly protein PilF
MLRFALLLVLGVICTFSAQAGIDFTPNLSEDTTISVEAQEKFNEGVTAFEQKQYAEAVEKFTSCIQLAPDFAKAYLNRGYAYTEMKKNAEAKAD